jgi:nitrogen regulatory protein P-II 1
MGAIIMNYLVVFVLNDADQCRDVLDAWESAGIHGITILESSGLGRVRQAGLREDTPLMPSLNNLFKHTETRHRTLFTAVKDDIQIDKIAEATRSIVGDLEQPDTGFLFVLPIHRVFGISKLA